jgi:Ni/Co efflux regulator RcnB
MGHGPGPGAGHRPGPSRPPAWHGWRKGDRFDRRRAQRYRILSRPSAYHLRPPPRGYHWVQSGNDAVLVAITTGIVASVIANAIR